MVVQTTRTRTLLRRSNPLLALLLLLTSCSLFAHSPQFFSCKLPKGWSIAPQNCADTDILATFIGKKAASFTPTLVLSCEAIGSMSKKEYLEQTEKLYKNSHEYTWTASPGQLETKAGKADFICLTANTPYGPLYLLQAILIDKGYAYIATASCPKKAQSTHLKLFHKMLTSLELNKSVVSSLSKKSQKRKLNTHLEFLHTKALEKNIVISLESLAHFLSTEFKEEGLGWHYLGAIHLHKELKTY